MGITSYVQHSMVTVSTQTDPVSQCVKWKGVYDRNGVDGTVVHYCAKLHGEVASYNVQHSTDATGLGVTLAVKVCGYFYCWLKTTPFRVLYHVENYSNALSTTINTESWFYADGSSRRSNAMNVDGTVVPDHGGSTFKVTSYKVQHSKWCDAVNSDPENGR